MSSTQWLLLVAGIIVALLLLGWILWLRLRPHFLAGPRPPIRIHNIAEFEQYMSDLVTFGDPPSLTVVVVKGQEVVYEKGFGYIDAACERHPTPDSVYRLWSVTKIFTAIAALQLAEQGKLNLDAPVTDYVSFFEVHYPSLESNRITVRHLLNHSSGLSDVGNQILSWIHFDGDTPFNQTHLVHQELPQFNKLVYEPGSEGQYSNLGYMVLGAVIEAVSGQTYEDYVVEHILHPLSMTNTHFVYTEKMKANEAIGSHPHDFMGIMARFMVDMRRLQQTSANGRIWFNRVYPNQTAPSGLISTSRDMARFMTALLNDGEIDGIPLLSPESLASMYANPRVVATKHEATGMEHIEFGLGWYYIMDGDRPTLAHGGTGMGFASLLRLYPDENLGVFVVGNSTYLGHSSGVDLTDMLASLEWQTQANPTSEPATFQ